MIYIYDIKLYRCMICMYTNVYLSTYLYIFPFIFPVNSRPMAHPPHASGFSTALRVQRRSCRQMRPQQLRDVAPAEAQRDVPGLGKMPAGSLGT